MGSIKTNWSFRAVIGWGGHSLLASVPCENNNLVKSRQYAVPLRNVLFFLPFIFSVHCSGGQLVLYIHSCSRALVSREVVTAVT